ncbi:MAG: cytochrome c nitrite reductase small subunit [Gemmatimonadota bacterium]
MTRRWLLLTTAILIGAAIGIGGYTFVYADGHSYLTDNPSACANCHIMDEHYRAWLTGSHGGVAGCNECHTPQDNVASKYTVKAKNGFWHSLRFTTGEFPYPIRITEPNRDVVEGACRSCHGPVVEAIDHGATASAATEGEDALRCVQCHRYVGHQVR